MFQKVFVFLIVSISAFAVFNSSIHNPATAMQEDADAPSDIEQWTENFRTFESSLKELHPDPFRTLSEEDFSAAVEDVIQRLPELTHDERTLELLRLASKISVDQGRDGHLGMIPPFDWNVMPLQLYAFEDGVFIVNALPPYEHLIGSRVTHFGATPTEDALQRVNPYIWRDNDYSALSNLMALMLVAKVLSILNIADDSELIDLRLERPDGDIEDVQIVPVFQLNFRDWNLTRLPAHTEPLYLSAGDEDYFLHYVESQRVLYIRLNIIQATSRSGETIVEFSQRISRAMNTLNVEKTVIDLRTNEGGNNQSYGPFLNFIENHPNINQPGKLFTIIGRYTFSAAGNLVTDLEKATHTLFVGEPSGGSPNQYGDGQTVALPYFELIVFIPTIYHQFSTPDDPRLATQPHLPVPLSSTDYFSQRDPALELIFDYQVD